MTSKVKIITWTSTYSTDGKVKANESTDYPAFYAAAHYSPGVPITGTNVGKWFLPTLGEWNLLSKNLNLELVDLRLGSQLNTTLFQELPHLDISHWNMAFTVQMVMGLNIIQDQEIQT